MKTMKALRFEKYGPPSVLTLQELAVPELRPGQALVELGPYVQVDDAALEQRELLGHWKKSCHDRLLVVVLAAGDGQMAAAVDVIVPLPAAALEGDWAGLDIICPTPAAMTISPIWSSGSRSPPVRRGRAWARLGRRDASTPIESSTFNITGNVELLGSRHDRFRPRGGEVVRRRESIQRSGISLF